MPPIYVALVHYPVCNRAGETVTTAITNLDIHDIARSCRTFGVDGFFLVTPLEPQQALIRRIVSHWVEGYGRKRVPTRAEALERVRVSDSVDAVIADIERRDGAAPLLVATSARRVGAVSFPDLRARIAQPDRDPVLLLFGTGYGLAPEVMQRVDVILEPIGDPDGWNHLSVRAAAAICLDRLLGGY